MLDISRDHLVLVHELDLRQHRSISAGTGATWLRLSGAISDVDADHRRADGSTRDGLGPVPRSRLGAQLESVAILQRRIDRRPHRLVARDDLDHDADVAGLALHRLDVVQLRAIQSLPVNRSSEQRRLRGSANNRSDVSGEDFYAPGVGAFVELWAVGDRAGVSLGHRYDVVRLKKRFLSCAIQFNFISLTAHTVVELIDAR